MKWKSQYVSLTIVLVSAFLLSGCGFSTEPKAGADETSLRVFGRFYGEYLVQNGGQAPTDAEQLKKFLDESSDSLQTLGINNVNDLLISPRDNEPLVVLYGSDVIADGPGGLPWVAYESKGADGKKYIIGARGAVEEMKTEQIEAILSP